MPKAETSPNPGGVAGVRRTPGGSAASREQDSESECEGRGRDTRTHTRTLCPNGPADLSRYPAVKLEPGAEPGAGPASPDEDEEDVYSSGGPEMEPDEERAAGERADSTSSKDFPLLNQSISPLLIVTTLPLFYLFLC